MSYRLNDCMGYRTWQYMAVTKDGYRSGPHTINEHLSGALLDYLNQRPLRTTFRAALWLVHGWNKIGPGVSYRLVIPNPGT